MKKHKRITEIFAFLLAAALILAGLIVPKILIEGQKETAFGNTQIIKMQGSAPISFIEDSDISQSELISRLSPGSGTPIVREPNQNELSMDAAFSTAKKEMQKLKDIGVIPDLHTQQYQLTSATLTANSGSDVAIWDIKFVYYKGGETEESGVLDIDAETGKIYSLYLSYPQSDSISNRDRALLFAQYHGIDTDKEDYEYIDNKDGGSLKIGSLMIQVESSNRPDNKFQMTIGIGITN